MIQKRLLRPDRVRRVPPSFNWIDHRLARDQLLDKCDPPSLALYLFLVAVSDAEGLSYYSDATITRRLKLDQPSLCRARSLLMQRGLIAYEKPLYQALSLEPALPASIRSSTGQRDEKVLSAGDIIQRLFAGGGQ